jgi:hypothetical protein
MDDLADIFADEESVVRGYIAIKGAKVTGHHYMGPDRTVSISFAHNTRFLDKDEEDVLVCYVEKERGKAPLIYPVVGKDTDGDS